MSDNLAAYGIMYGLGIIFLGAVAIGALIGGIIVAIIWLVSYLF